MNTFYRILIAMLLLLSHSVLAVGLSETNNGIYLAVAAWSENSRDPFVSTEPIQFNDHLIWGAFTNGGNVRLCYPSPVFGVRIKMSGPNGKDVPKTALGRTFGAKWDDLHSFKDGKLGSTDAWGAFDLRGGGFTGTPLPAPKELFQMEQPGIYVLELEMQMFHYAASTDPKVWQTNLMRFSPIKIKVAKPR